MNRYHFHYSLVERAVEEDPYDEDGVIYGELASLKEGVVCDSVTCTLELVRFVRERQIQLLPTHLSVQLALTYCFNTAKEFRCDVCDKKYDLEQEFQELLEGNS